MMAENNTETPKIKEEFIYKKIFSQCDAENEGVVKVSTLIQYITPFIKSSRIQHKQLESILDPHNIDPLIDYNMFSELMNNWSASCNDSEADSNFNEEEVTTRLSVAENNDGIIREFDLNSSINSTYSYSGSIHNLTDPNALKEEIEELKFQNKKLMETIKEAEIQLTTTEEANNYLQCKIEKLNKRHQTDQRVIEELQKEKMRSDKENEEVVHLAKEYTSVMESLKLLKKENTQLTKENADFEGEIKRLQELIYNHQDVDSLKNNQIDEFVKQLKEKDKEIISLQEEIFSFKDYCANKEKRIEEILEENETMKFENTILKSQVDDFLAETNANLSSELSSAFEEDKNLVASPENSQEESFLQTVKNIAPRESLQLELFQATNEECFGATCQHKLQTMRLEEENENLISTNQELIKTIEDLKKSLKDTVDLNHKQIEEFTRSQEIENNNCYKLLNILNAYLDENKIEIEGVVQSEKDVFQLPKQLQPTLNKIISSLKELQHKTKLLEQDLSKEKLLTEKLSKDKSDLIEKGNTNSKQIETLKKANYHLEGIKVTLETKWETLSKSLINETNEKNNIQAQHNLLLSKNERLNSIVEKLERKIQKYRKTLLDVHTEKNDLENHYKTIAFIHESLVSRSKNVAKVLKFLADDLDKYTSETIALWEQQLNPYIQNSCVCDATNDSSLMITMEQLDGYLVDELSTLASQINFTNSLLKILIKIAQQTMDDAKYSNNGSLNNQCAISSEQNVSERIITVVNNDDFDSINANHLNGNITRGRLSTVNNTPLLLSHSTNGNVIAFPNLPDHILKSMGFLEQESREPLNEEQIEEIFQKLLLIFSIDAGSVDQRHELQKRQKDSVEEDVEMEVFQIKRAMENLLMINNDRVTEMVNAISLHLNTLIKVIEDVALTNHVYGSVKQEYRLTAAVTLMFAHVKNLQDKQRIQSNPKYAVNCYERHDLATVSQSSDSQNGSYSAALVAENPVMPQTPANNFIYSMEEINEENMFCSNVNVSNSENTSLDTSITTENTSLWHFNFISFWRILKILFRFYQLNMINFFLFIFLNIGILYIYSILYRNFFSREHQNDEIYWHLMTWKEFTIFLSRYFEVRYYADHPIY